MTDLSYTIHDARRDDWLERVEAKADAMVRNGAEFDTEEDLLDAAEQALEEENAWRGNP